MLKYRHSILIPTKNTGGDRSGTEAMDSGKPENNGMCGLLPGGDSAGPVLWTRRQHPVLSQSQPVSGADGRNAGTE